MFILSTYTTDRDDLDLIPSVVLSCSENRESLIDCLIKEVLNDTSNYNFEVYSNCFEENFEYCDHSTDTATELERFLRKQFADDTVNSIAVKYDYVLSNGTVCDYENVYTINDLNTVIAQKD